MKVKQIEAIRALSNIEGYFIKENWIPEWIISKNFDIALNYIIEHNYNLPTTNKTK